MSGSGTFETLRAADNDSFEDVDIRQAEESDIGGILSIFRVSFETGYPRLWRLMYEDNSSDPLHYMVEGIVDTHLNSRDCRIMVAYEREDEWLQGSEGSQDSGFGMNSDSDLDEYERNLTFGFISLSMARSPAARDVYETSDLRSYACLEVLKQAHVHRGDSRFRLADDLEYRSKRGQTTRLHHPYLVVNALHLFPGGRRELMTQEMANQLLVWAVHEAERHSLAIWTQVPIDEKGSFLRVGFTEVGRFTLNLNHYKPHGSRRDWGRQDWVQMVYYRRHA